MFDKLTTIFPAILLTSILSILVSWICLKIICYSSPTFLSFLNINSGKSATNARLLGGLSISASLLIAISFLRRIYPESINAIEMKVISYALLSIAMVTLYGYIDDKFEVRVRFKLSLQLISVLSFAFFNAANISAEYPVLAFIGSSIFGLALVNGTNLLDGLDTLSIKLGTVSSLAFLYLGIIANSTVSIYLSIILIASYSVFYFFNREPAKIYMGEIGGSLIGLIYFIQSSMCFSSLHTKMSMVHAFSLVLIASCYPICELGVSFIRRIVSKKTPFRGDKLHLHYVMKNKYNLSSSVVSSRLGILGFLILAFGFIIAKSYNPSLGITLVTLTTLQCYLWVCLNEWQASYKNENIANVFKLFEGKKVNIIDSTSFNTFDIAVGDKNKDIKKKGA